jgi:hypothetical protein
MRLAFLVVVIVMLSTFTNASKKCYTRTLVNCVTNADRNNGQVIDYRVTSKRDVFLDLRLGPVANRPAQLARRLGERPRYALFAAAAHRRRAG